MFIWTIYNTVPIIVTGLYVLLHSRNIYTYTSYVLRKAWVQEKPDKVHADIENLDFGD